MNQRNFDQKITSSENIHFMFCLNEVWEKPLEYRVASFHMKNTQLYSRKKLDSILFKCTCFTIIIIIIIVWTSEFGFLKHFLIIWFDFYLSAVRTRLMFRINYYSLRFNFVYKNKMPSTFGSLRFVFFFDWNEKKIK